MDSVFKALSDPNRRKILRLLKRRDMNVTEIASHFDFTGATLSHHLDALKRANLVVTERRGQFIVYSLNTSVLEDVLSTFYSFFRK
jgi:DNA-binding transcriptional ArsR family regulator